MDPISISIFCTAGSYIIKKILDSAVKKLKKVWNTRKQQKKEELVYGTIATNYPKIDGTGRPWIGFDTWYKSYESKSFEVNVDIDNKKYEGTLIIPLKNIQGTPKVESYAGMVEVNLPYGAEVDLETGDNFLTDNYATLKLNFGVPSDILQSSIDYDTQSLSIPLKFVGPVKSVKHFYIKPPNVIPKQTRKIDIPFGRKVDAEIPLFGYSL